jgi:hypothetical protein
MFRGNLKDVSACSKIPNDRAHDLHPFGAEQLALEPRVAAKPAEPSGGGNNAVARDVPEAASAHDVAHCPARPRMSRRLRDVAIGGDSACRNSSNEGQDAGGE